MKWQRDAGSGMKSRMSGIFSAIKIKSIQQGQEPTELPWLGFGKLQEEIKQFMIR